MSRQEKTQIAMQSDMITYQGFDAYQTHDLNGAVKY